MATASTPTSEDRRAQVIRSGRNGSNRLGELLRSARERRGLTLERIARETKIPQRHLEAFERDNLTAVPSGFYQRAELRTYAQAVGLDQRLALAELESALTPADTFESRENRRKEASTSPLPYIAAAVAGIAVIAALLGRASIEPASQPQPRLETPAPAELAATPLASNPSSEPETATPALAQSTPATQSAAEPAAAAAPVPAESVTELVVTTEPVGARVTVNGIGWGASPARIQYLEPGTKIVRVSKEGYVAVERVLQVDEGRRQALDIQLEPAP